MTEKKEICRTCRWWTGDRERISGWLERDNRGNCSLITPSNAPPYRPARLRPIGGTAILSTRYDFSCVLWEEPRAQR